MAQVKLFLNEKYIIRVIVVCGCKIKWMMKMKYERMHFIKKNNISSKNMIMARMWNNV